MKGEVINHLLNGLIICTDMSFKIGSINMYKFSNQKNDEISKNIPKIADLIIEEEFDIVALQEVLNESALHRLKSELGSNWESIWDFPVSRSQQAAEGYAFLWNKNRFRLATATTKEEQQSDRTSKYSGRTFTPRIHSNYNMGDKGKLIRDPFYARFESIQGWYEIRLINTHIVYSNSNANAKDIRKKEFEILQSIYDKLEDKVYRNSRTPYTFLLGDYNLSLDDLNNIGKKENIFRKKDAMTCFEVHHSLAKDRDGSVKTITTVQHELSTLKAKSRTDPDAPTTGFANNYDHFTYDEKLKKSLSLNCERINSVEKYWENDFDLHRKEFSDHVPIRLNVEFK